MKFHIGFPKLCANETLLNEFYKDVSVHIPSSMEVWSDMRRVSDILWLQKSLILTSRHIQVYSTILKAICKSPRLNFLELENAAIFVFIKHEQKIACIYDCKAKCFLTSGKGLHRYAYIESP